MSRFRLEVFAATVLCGLAAATLAFSQQANTVVNQPGPTTGTGNWVRATTPTITTPNISGLLSGAAGVDLAIQAPSGFSLQMIGNGAGASHTLIWNGAVLTMPQVSYIKLATTTVASLVTCNTGAEGQQAVVTDANATTFHSTVAAGGANHVLVVCLNSAWAIGG